jgi:transcriptional regulator with XRE-family HTH domain
MVALWEAGQGLPRLPSVEKLARALGVSPGWLAYGLGEAAEPVELGVRCEGLAERAKTTRTQAALSMREVARRAGITEGAVRSTEKGRQPGIDTMEKLAGALGVSPAWLAFGIGPRELPRRRMQATKPPCQIDGTMR